MDRIGQLRARVRLMKPARTADDLGGTAMSWTDEGPAWAWIEPAGGGESAAFDRLTPQPRYRMTIRNRADITTGWRVLWGARVFRVRVTLDAPNARRELECEEEAP